MTTTPKQRAAKHWRHLMKAGYRFEKYEDRVVVRHRHDSPLATGYRVSTRWRIYRGQTRVADDFATRKAAIAFAKRDCPLPVNFTITPETRGAIIAVAGYCAADMEHADAADAEIVAEVAIDASRLTTNGNSEADAEISALIAEHGYPEVLAAVAQFVPTA